MHEWNNLDAPCMCHLKRDIILKHHIVGIFLKQKKSKNNRDGEMLRFYNSNKIFKTLYRHDGERGGKLMRAIRWASFTRNFLRSGLLAETLVFITTEQSFQALETVSYNALRLPICNKRNQREDINVNGQYVIYESKYAHSSPVDNHKKESCV